LTDVKLALPIQVAGCMPPRDRWLLLIRLLLLPQASQSIIKTECRRDAVQSSRRRIAIWRRGIWGLMVCCHADISQTDTAQFGSFLQAMKRDVQLVS